MLLKQGTSNGTITNVQGEFTLSVAPNSILGYKLYWITSLYRLPVGEETSFNIVLEEDTQALDENCCW